MTKENYTTMTAETIFPEKSNLIIERILEKYGLKEKQDKGMEKFFDSEVSEERRILFENLPGTKIAKLVAEYATGIISLDIFPQTLEKDLGIDGEKAEQVCKELEKTLLVFIKQGGVLGEEETPSLINKISGSKRKPTDEPPLSEKTKDVTEDSYRESPE